MSKKKIYVAESGIHGKGLFAKKPIQAGELIGVVQGKITRKNGDHVLWVNEEYGVRVQCDMRYINHDPKPNACYYNTLEVIALRDIAPDEEITHDYQWD
ncbi:MAG: SET domain-containing protein [Gammaproteobacteria bacterium]|nr:SET domain-containing protein [Gammaproteobacteria bacterium]